MHEKLRRAEGRVAALEKELLDNTRRWARDKAELQVKFHYAVWAISRWASSSQGDDHIKPLLVFLAQVK